MRERVVEQHHAALAARVADAVEAARRSAVGEAARQRFLLGGEDADAVALRSPSSAAYSDASRSTQTCTSGGSRLTEQNALTVIPTSRLLASRVVTTVMPEAKRPRTLRKESGSIVMRLVRESVSRSERDSADTPGRNTSRAGTKSPVTPTSRSAMSFRAASVRAK